jgi:hypothetical protein
VFALSQLEQVPKPPQEVGEIGNEQQQSHPTFASQEVKAAFKL